MFGNTTTSSSSPTKSKNKETLTKQQLELVVPLVVKELNHITGRVYKFSSAGTRKHISARLKDGYTEDDLLRVVRYQCAEWLGTKQEKYLRPETLFNQTKFENYHNEARIKQANGIHATDVIKSREKTDGYNEESTKRLWEFLNTVCS